jgi:hypothetical protein
VALLGREVFTAFSHPSVSYYGMWVRKPFFNRLWHFQSHIFQQHMEFDHCVHILSWYTARHVSTSKHLICRADTNTTHMRSSPGHSITCLDCHTENYWKILHTCALCSDVCLCQLWWVAPQWVQPHCWGIHFSTFTITVTIPVFQVEGIGTCSRWGHF